MPEQQDTFDRPFCQTAIPRGRSRAFFVRILSVDRPLYLSLYTGTVDGLGTRLIHAHTHTHTHCTGFLSENITRGAKQNVEKVRGAIE